MMTNPEHSYGLHLALFGWFQGQGAVDRLELERLEQQLIQACERYFIRRAVGTAPAPPLLRECSAMRCGQPASVIIITAPDRRTYACAEHAEWLLEVLERP